MQDEHLMRYRDQAYERFEAEWEECLKRFSRSKATAPVKCQPIEQAYASPPPGAIHATLRGFTALVVTFALFTGGLAVLTAPAPASATPVTVELA